MNANKKSRLKYNICLLVTALLMIPFFFAAKSAIAALVQTNEKVFKTLSWGNEPVEIVNLRNKQQEIKLNEPFASENAHDSDEWIKEFKIKYKNKSDKAIIGLTIELDLPETKTTGNIMSFPLSFGLSATKFAQKSKIENRLKPSENIELQLTDKDFDALKSFIEKRQPFSSINKVDIRVSFILFEDGTAWTGGNFARPDPYNPNKYIPINTVQ